MVTILNGQGLTAEASMVMKSSYPFAIFQPPKSHIFTQSVVNKLCQGISCTISDGYGMLT